MDESEESQQQQEEVIDSADQMVYGVPHYLEAGPGGVATAVPVSAPTSSDRWQQQPAAAAYSQAQHFYQQQQLHRQNQLQTFWANQMQEIEQMADFKNHSLPLARIKKIMKADEDVRMISSEAPVIFAKACEMFILELTMRSWLHTEENKRRTLQKNDIAAAISRTDVFDFLVDIIPRDELREEGLGVTNPTTVPRLGPPADSVPYYYVPQQHAGGQAGLFYPNGAAASEGQAGFYPNQQPHLLPWQQPRQHQIQDEENGN